MREINPRPGSLPLLICVPCLFLLGAPMQLHFLPLLLFNVSLSLALSLAPKSHFFMLHPPPHFSLRSHADLDALMKHVSPTWSDVL